MMMVGKDFIGYNDAFKDKRYHLKLHWLNLALLKKSWTELLYKYLFKWMHLYRPVIVIAKENSK